jgi:pimeloyl-ACP methyl ester carboxylesterase
MTMGIWKQFIKRFSKEFRVILFDFPHQGSGELLSEPYRLSFDEQLECIEQVTKQVSNIDSLYVFGASWGAVLALAYSARHPDKVKKQILGSCAIRSNKKLDMIVDKGISYYQNKEGSRVSELLANELGGNIPAVYRQQIVRQFERISHQHAEAFYHHTNFVRESRLEDLVDLPKIIADSLFIYGDKDEVCSTDDAHFLHKNTKRSKVITIKDTGHFLHLENKSVMDIYEEFFS